jgi:hypothetical protein
VIFGDVASGSFYDDAVGELYGLGIVKGKSPTTYDPNGLVTRGEVAVLLKRLRDDIKGYSQTSTPVPASSSSTSSRSTSSSSVAVSTDAGTLKFSNSTISFPKSAPKASFTVVRTGGTKGAVTVHYKTVDGTAVSPTNYIANEGTINFAAGEEAQTVYISLKNTSADDYNKAFTIVLSAPTGGAVLGSPSTVTVNVLDLLGVNPAGSSSSSSSSSVSSGGSSSSSSSAATTSNNFSLSASTYSVFEDGGSIAITVKRNGSTSNQATVNFATSNRTNSASAGSEYTAINGTLTFAAGETSKTFSVQITNHAGSIEGNKSFNVSLSAPTGGPVLGIQTSSIVTIIDKDAPYATGSGMLVFASDTFPGPKGAMATVNVQRQQSFNGTMTVHYATNDASALSNADYTPTSGDLTFAPGEVTKTFQVFVLAGATTGHEIGLSLSAVNGGVLGTPFVAKVTVQ